MERFVRREREGGNYPIILQPQKEKKTNVTGFRLIKRGMNTNESIW